MDTSRAISPGGKKRIAAVTLTPVRRWDCGVMLALQELVAPIFLDTQTLRHAALPTRS